MLDAAAVEEALSLLGALLAEDGLQESVVVVGGSSLLLLGFIARPTADVDVVALATTGGYRRADSLPVELAQRVADVGATLGLRSDWLNAGPTALLDLGLPQGFAARAVVRRYGGLEVQLAAREDLLALKLYALVDQGTGSKHLPDLKAMSPSQEELLWAARWARTHDPSPGFRRELLAALAFLGLEVADADL